MAIKINGSTVISDSQAITSTSTISATGNITGGNVSVIGSITAAGINTGSSPISTTGNVTGGNILTGGLISAAATITGGNIAFGTGIVSGTGNITGANINTGGLVSATGNVTGDYLLGNAFYVTGLSPTQIYSGTSNVTVTGPSANISVAVGGTPNVVVWATTGTYTTGLSSVTGNVIGGNIRTVGQVSATANVTGGNVLTGGLISSTGNISTQGIVSATGNIVTAGLFVGNFQGNVVGNLSVPGSNTQVLFNTGGSADAVAGLTYNKDSNTLGVLGVISSQGNIIGGNVTPTGNVVLTDTKSISIGSLVITDDTIRSTEHNITIGSLGNIGNVIIGGNLTVNGNTTTFNSNVISTNDLTYNLANNASTSAQANGGGIEVGPVGSPFITWLYNNASNVWTSSGGISAVTGVSGASLSTSGTVSATGNITGGNISATNHTGTNVSVTGTVTAASTVGGVITGTSVSVSGSVTGGAHNGTSVSVSGGVTAASVAGGVITGTSTSVTGTTTAASTVGGVITGTSVSVTGTINGTTLTGTGLTVTTGNITGGNLILSGTIEDSGQLDIRTTASNGNIVLTPNGTGNVNIGANIMPTANATANIGSAALSYNTIFAKATSALYADLAENYAGDAEYAPGTVVDFGGNQEVTISTVDMSSAVAGVVSTNPSYLMNAGQAGDTVVAVALTGRVPTKVTGTVRKGDLMVSAGNGAARAEADPRVGTVIGKALADSEGSAVIEVVVGRF